jgi:hypothetical protein
VEKNHFSYEIYNKKDTLKQMSNLNVNLEKASRKWGKLIESFGVTEKSKIEWMSEYATYHNANESVAYAQGVNVSGMGAVQSPIASGIPGQTIGGYSAGDSFGANGVIGSGDLGQSLIPAAMKIAAQTIGLDLVAVKPSAGPVIDLVFVDYRYDDGALSTTPTYIPVIFQITPGDADAQLVLDRTSTAIRTFMANNSITEIQGGLSQRLFMNLNMSTTVTVSTATTEPTSSKADVVEFLGFSRIDKNPMFKAFRSTNSVPAGNYAYDTNNNTFAAGATVVDVFKATVGATLATGITPTTVGIAFNATTMRIGFLNTSWDTVEDETKPTNIKIALVSALEDHIFSASSSNGLNPMTRAQDDNYYAGVIAPNVQTKRIQIGTIEVSSALRLSEIEDIKSQTGIDIVSKVEGVLANELAQNISKDIVSKIKALGALNAKSAPLISPGVTVFDFDVDAYLGTGAPGGETKQSLQNGLVTKVRNASGFIMTEGRVGPATFLVTNNTLATALTQGAAYELSKVDNSTSNPGQLFPAGKVAGIQVYVDPYQLYTDNRITLGRKNNPDQPGLVFVPYLMAQTVKIISEATFAPRMLLRSRYAVAELGFFPQKQYLTISVTDVANRLA